ncbi:MAG: DUF1080 domain-containing protein [Verrucomicrobiota bacterium]|nr:DUF1080 domain-containing protein [Verrucomicrobiota bacterium]
MKRIFILSSLLFLCIAFAYSRQFPGTYTDLNDENLPSDFMYQGEYEGAGYGAQVISLDKGFFHIVLYQGGLPGEGWNGTDRSLLDGKIYKQGVSIETADGKRKYLAANPKEFSATRKFPPIGHKAFSGSIDGKRMQLLGTGNRNLILNKTTRKSPTLEKKAPSKALVLFDGTNKNNWEGGRLDQKTKLLNTDGKDIRTKKKFSNYHLHLEFLLPYRPRARGQGRGNSGLYNIDMYENQILDSFGLEGLNNECGGIYSITDSRVNACFPPLSWQTYDIDFTNARSKNGKKISNARITARLNGILIHENFEIPRKTGGSRNEPEGTSGSIKLQGHGNPLQFRNIWIVEK